MNMIYIFDIGWSVHNAHFVQYIDRIQISHYKGIIYATELSLFNPFPNDKI